MGADRNPGPERRRVAEAAPMNEHALSVFEVFRQEKPTDAFTHEGSVVAPDVDLACQYALSVFSRRAEAYRLWVVPRAAIRQIDDPDLLRPPGDHRYRLARTYRGTIEKRRKLRARVLGEAP